MERKKKCLRVELDHVVLMERVFVYLVCRRNGAIHDGKYLVIWSNFVNNFTRPWWMRRLRRARVDCPEKNQMMMMIYESVKSLSWL